MVHSMCQLVNTAVILALWKSCQPNCDLQTADWQGVRASAKCVCERETL